MTTPLGKSIRTVIENWTDPTSPPTIIHLKQETGPQQNDQNQFPIRILNSGIDVPRSGLNIDNCTGMKPQGPIMNTIPESNRVKNLDILDSFRKTSDLSYMVFPWHVTMKKETINPVENLRDNLFSNMMSAKIVSMLKKLAAKFLLIGITPTQL